MLLLDSRRADAVNCRVNCGSGVVCLQDFENSSFCPIESMNRIDWNSKLYSPLDTKRYTTTSPYPIQHVLRLKIGHE